MRVVGVLDLAGGRAVHAVRGHRDRYVPVTTVAGVRIDPGEPLALARTYLDSLGLTELYVADLDAIESRGSTPPRGPAAASHDPLVAAIAGLGATLWLDAGVRSVAEASHARELGATKVVIGLETLPSYDALAEICGSVGAEAVVFSLDLRNGVPVFAAGFPSDDSAGVVAARAADCGATSIIALDLARVGTETGPDLALIARLRAVVPAVTLLAGGGVRGREDLAMLADAGCDGALVATALQDGRLSAEDVRAARLRQPRRTR